MKKVFSVLMVAFAMTAMVACSKDDNKGSNNNEPTSGIANNTLIYDGTKYTFDYVGVGYFHQSLTLMGATTSDTLENGEPLLTVDGIHITPEIWNKDIDLANQDQWVDGMVIDLVFNGAFNMSYAGYYNGDKDINGELDGVSYEHESIFTSGTYHVSGNNDGTPITVTLNGVLKNGKTLQMKLVSGNYNVRN